MVIKTYGFKLFGKTIPFYGILFVVGFAIAIAISIPKKRKYKISGVDMTVSAVFAAIGGVVGAKLLAVITAIPTIIEFTRTQGRFPFAEILQGGFVFYGGLIGGALGLFIYCKAFKQPFAQLADVYAPGTALGHSFGRVGCLFSGCCFGRETTGPFYVIYETAADTGTPLGVKLLPTQLIEVMYLIVIFAVCEALFWKTEKSGNTAITYALSYVAARFILEFFRADAARGGFGGMSTSQYISFFIFLICYAVILLRVLRKYGVLKEREPKPRKPKKQKEENA